MYINEIEVTDLVGLLDEQEDISIIDVREAQEVATGMVPGSAHIPMVTLPMRVDELPRDKKIVMVCRSGARSAQCCYWLMQQGFDNVHNLRGGMIAWHSSGLALQQSA
ncbi:MAG: rhodanese-like domain-containing protein [Granulosicoccaceae bacterium]|jgi:rhodanese-related sulfurtransferase